MIGNQDNFYICDMCIEACNRIADEEYGETWRDDARRELDDYLNKLKDK